MANKQHTPEEKAFNAAQCSICLLDWPMAQCLACKFHQPETEVEFNPQTMELFSMRKSTVTVQEMDRVSRTIGLKMYNDQAMRKVCLMVRLGFDATLEMYQREERNTNEAEQRKQAAEVTNDNNWIGFAFETLTKDNENKQAKSFIELAKAHQERVKANEKVWVKPENCQHEKARAIHSGMRCDECRETFPPRNEFEQRLVNEKNPRSSGYVNWKMR